MTAADVGITAVVGINLNLAICISYTVNINLVLAGFSSAGECLSAVYTTLSQCTANGELNTDIRSYAAAYACAELSACAASTINSCDLQAMQNNTPRVSSNTIVSSPASGMNSGKISVAVGVGCAALLGVGYFFYTKRGKNLFLSAPAANLQEAQENNDMLL